VYVVGKVLDDDTVMGGTGWGAEFAKLCNKPVHVFDQERNGWLRWTGIHQGDKSHDEDRQVGVRPFLRRG
jgi:hypothetical protein